MSDRDPEAPQNARLLTVLIWAGVGLAPVAALVVLLAGSDNAIRFAVLLTAVCVVLIGAALLIRNDSVLPGTDVEEKVEALRGELREEIAASGRAAGHRVKALQDEMTRMRAAGSPAMALPPAGARPAAAAAPGGAGTFARPTGVVAPGGAGALARPAGAVAPGGAGALARPAGVVAPGGAGALARPAGVVAPGGAGAFVRPAGAGGSAHPAGAAVPAGAGTSAGPVGPVRPAGAAASAGRPEAGHATGGRAGVAGPLMADPGHSTGGRASAEVPGRPVAAPVRTGDASQVRAGGPGWLRSANGGPAPVSNGRPAVASASVAPAAGHISVAWVPGAAGAAGPAARPASVGSASVGSTAVGSGAVGSDALGSVPGAAGTLPRQRGATVVPPAGGGGYRSAYGTGVPDPDADLDAQGGSRAVKDYGPGLSGSAWAERSAPAEHGAAGYGEYGAAEGGPPASPRPSRRHAAPDTGTDIARFGLSAPESPAGQSFGVPVSPASQGYGAAATPVVQGYGAAATPASQSQGAGNGLQGGYDQAGDASWTGDGDDGYADSAVPDLPATGGFGDRASSFFTEEDSGGFAPDSGYPRPNEPDQSAADGYSLGAAQGWRNDFGQPAVSAEVDGYGQASSYGLSTSYGQANGHGPNGYGQANGHDPDGYGLNGSGLNGSGQLNGFGQANGFGRADGYDSNGGHEQVTAYDGAEGYEESGDHGQANGYGLTTNYGQVDGYDEDTGRGQARGHGQDSGHDGADQEDANGYEQANGYDLGPVNGYGHTAAGNAQAAGTYGQAAGTYGRAAGSYAEVTGDARAAGTYGQAAGTYGRVEDEYGQAAGDYSQDEGRADQYGPDPMAAHHGWAPRSHEQPGRW